MKVESAESYFATINNQTLSSSSVTMGKDDFLKLLITELQNQNPLNPMEDREFISQMANFSTLEQMQNMNKGFEYVGLLLEQSLGSMYLEQCCNLINKDVEYSIDGNLKQGIVEGIVMNNGIPQLKISEDLIFLDEVLSITNSSIVSPVTEDTTSGENIEDIEEYAEVKQSEEIDNEQSEGEANESA